MASNVDQKLMSNATDPSQIKLKSDKQVVDPVKSTQYVSDENKPSPACPKGQEYTKNTNGMWECVNEPTFTIKKDSTGMWECVSNHTNSISSKEYNKPLIQEVDPPTCPKGQKPNQNTTGKWECVESPIPAEYSYATEDSTQPNVQATCLKGQVYTEVSKGKWECR